MTLAVQPGPPRSLAACSPHRTGETRGMDLGIREKRAIVCGGSKGLGRACAQALANEGVRVTITARTRDTLEAAAREIEAEAGAPVTPVVADITTPAGRAALLEACAEPDILVNNTGGEPPGEFHEWTHDDWISALEANMLTPIELIKGTVDGMIARRFGRIINITSSTVKAPIQILGLTNGVRSGLTGFVAGLARDVAQYGITINNMLPGAFDTGRLHTVLGAAAQRAGRTFEEQVEARRQSIPARRLGTPDEFGALCAFMCSARAGYITGQNLLIDGGAYPGTL
jgi:3-oxoacyl-[acyl-carrier protein] reductase